VFSFSFISRHFLIVLVISSFTHWSKKGSRRGEAGFPPSREPNARREPDAGLYPRILGT